MTKSGRLDARRQSMIAEEFHRDGEQRRVVQCINTSLLRGSTRFHEYSPVSSLRTLGRREPGSFIFGVDLDELSPVSQLPGCSTAIMAVVVRAGQGPLAFCTGRDVMIMPPDVARPTLDSTNTSTSVDVDAFIWRRRSTRRRRFLIEGLVPPGTH